MFSGDAHIELRPPKDLEDFRTFTALNLSLHQPQLRGDGRRRRQVGEDNQFVLYLGNKQVRRTLFTSFIRDASMYMQCIVLLVVLIINRQSGISLAWL